MRLKLERLRDHAESSLLGVTGVSVNTEAGSTRNTSDRHGVSGVSSTPIRPAPRTPEKLETLSMFRRKPYFYAGETPQTLETPQIIGKPISAEEPSAPPPQDFSIWAGDWNRWALECCLFRDRCFGGVKPMHSDFCDWCFARELVPCSLPTFAAVLEDEGFLVTSGMVSGLVLEEDFAKCEA